MAGTWLCVIGIICDLRLVDGGSHRFCATCLGIGKDGDENHATCYGQKHDQWPTLLLLGATTHDEIPLLMIVGLVVCMSIM